jgi:hypothetical protein
MDFFLLSNQTRSSTVRCVSVGSWQINVLLKHDKVRPLKSPILTPFKAITGFDEPSNSSA